MRPDSSSLLEFLDAPVIVGDPDGRAVYANPAFASRFGVDAGGPGRRHLGELFEGGGREAVLQALADVCASGRTLRFRVRARGAGYAALASPITAEGTAVGALILLTEETLGEERLLGLQREVHEPLDELDQCLSLLIDQTGGRRSDRHRALLEDGQRALGRLRKWSEELRAEIAGRGAERHAALDPASCVRAAAARVQAEFGAAGVAIELLIHSGVPRARGDAGHLETALVRLLRDRLVSLPRGAAVTLSARPVGRDADAGALVSLVEPPSDESAAERPDPELVRRIVEACGGSLAFTDDPAAGRTTAIQLPPAPRA